MSLSRKSYEESLARAVLDTGRCVGCGACVIVCPFSCIDLEQEKPRLTKECQKCGICAAACPEYERSSSEMERYVFGRQRKPDEKFGIFKQIAAVQATDNTVLRASQDGGFVTTLLLYALDSGFIDGAIVSGIAEKTPFLPFPKLASSPQAILESAGTRYFYSANILALPATAGKATALAFVGTPCQIRAIRKMQASGLKKYVANIKLLIGLMCSECFSYNGLMKELQEKLGIRPAEIRKININGKMLVTTEKETKLLSLAEAKRHSRESCGFCQDFSSEFLISQQVV